MAILTQRATNLDAIRDWCSYDMADFMLDVAHNKCEFCIHSDGECLGACLGGIVEWLERREGS